MTDQTSDKYDDFITGLKAFGSNLDEVMQEIYFPDK